MLNHHNGIKMAGKKGNCVVDALMYSPSEVDRINWVWVFLAVKASFCSQPKSPKLLSSSGLSQEGLIVRVKRSCYVSCCTLEPRATFGSCHEFMFQTFGHSYVLRRHQFTLYRKLSHKALVTTDLKSQQSAYNARRIYFTVNANPSHIQSNSTN